MGFFRRFSADYRAAVAAEAAGELEVAAERYALAGYYDEAARIHLSRAERSSTYADEIRAFRDALHWAPDDGEYRRPAIRGLGRALLAQARAEGIATKRDRQRVSEAARLLAAAGEWLEAGRAWEAIGEESQAAHAYGQGGHLERLEEVLGREGEQTLRARRLRESFADYELHSRCGARDAALDDLRVCVEVAEHKSEYRRLLDDLQARLITKGSATLELRRGVRLVASGAAQVSLGRDPLCDVVLRSGGVSRRHAQIQVTEGPGREGSRFCLADFGSRNGTLVGGLPIAGRIPLHGTGRFALGDACDIEYAVAGDPARLTLRICDGLDAGMTLVAAGEGESIPLCDAVGLQATVEFSRGRPLLAATDGRVRLNGEWVTHGGVQLVRGDQLLVAGVEFEVA